MTPRRKLLLTAAVAAVVLVGMMIAAVALPGHSMQALSAPSSPEAQDSVRAASLWESLGGGGVGDGAGGKQASGDTGGTGRRKPGEVIMGRMANETLKAELGRSAWRLLHTMASKFPYEPTADERAAMSDFIYLFARLYPCGDCAAHFKKILAANPPDVSGREGVSQWACKVHNLVNERLGKPQFDCKTVGDLWMCGCADDETPSASLAAGPAASTTSAAAASASPAAVDAAASAGAGVSASPTVS